MPLHSAFQLVFGIFVAWVASYQLLGCDRPARKSPAAFRREKALYVAERNARRYGSIPRARKAVNEERRFKLARAAAVSAIRWALVDAEFNRSEIDGSVIRVLHKNKALVFDPDALHRECLATLNRATCQER
jgi:hypothetical protein